LEFEKAEYVSTTADCWTSRRRSFLGINVHWMGRDLDRRSACLGDRRIFGSHTMSRPHSMSFDKAISDIDTEFKISSKVNILHYN
jgi:hypothetical protein